MFHFSLLAPHGNSTNVDPLIESKAWLFAKVAVHLPISGLYEKAMQI